MLVCIFAIFMDFLFPLLPLFEYIFHIDDLLWLQYSDNLKDNYLMLLTHYLSIRLSHCASL